MQGIEIPIGAPLGQLDKDLKGAKSKLNQFAQEASKTSAVLGGSVAKGSDQAAFALTNLSRVAQDAPFGFVGIQNNLNPLLESFTRLKQETGSTGSALKALGQSLIGPAGLGFALSAISAGILLYQQYQQRANKEATNAKKVTDDYINSLNQLDQARLKGGQNAAAEISTLKVLFNQYQNSNLPLEKRKDAYAELQKLYPSYFGNLKFESTATEKTKNAYNALTESIIASARARAAVDLITKNSTRQLENEQKIIDLTTQITQEQNKQRKLQNVVDTQNLLAKQEANILTSEQRKVLNQYLTAGAKEIELTRLKNNLITDTNILTQKNIELEKAAAVQREKNGTLTDITPDKIKTPKKQEFKRDPLINVQPSLNELDRFLIEYRKTEALINKTPLIPIVDIQPKLITPINEWANYVNGTLLPKLQGNFETFFNDILTKGQFSFAALGKAILNTLASVVASETAKSFIGLFSVSTGKDGTDAQKKGKGLLGFATSALGLFGKGAGAGAAAGGAGTAAGATAASGGALLPILAGAAAVAGIASLFKKKPKTTAPLPQTSSTISTTAASSYQDFGGGRVVFEISGTNLIGVLNRAGAKLQRFG